MSSKFLQLGIFVTLLAFVLSVPCPSGKYTDANNLCQPCMTNCASCSSAEFCNACIGNTFLVSSAFSTTCQPCSVVLSGCSICLTNIACKTCSSGYFLDNSGCSSCGKNVQQCATCSDDGKTCYQCRHPYILVDNVCLSTTVSALTQGAQTVTINGSNIVKLENGTVVPATLDSNKCNQLQVYWNGKCIKRIDQCQVYQLSGLCQICHAGYLVTIFGDCAPNSTVLQCENGYWHNSVADKCEKVSVACDWYFPNNGSCFNCSKNYVMTSERKCLPNLNCNSRQFFYEGECVSVPFACLNFTSDGNCTSCAEGNTLKNGVCTLTISTVAFNDCVFPCQTCFYSKLDYCFSCRFGYELQGHQYGTCVPILY